MFSESHPDHLKVWNDVKDHFLLKILDQALNTIPESDKLTSDFSEKEFDHWLTKQNFSEKGNRNTTFLFLSFRWNPIHTAKNQIL